MVIKEGDWCLFAFKFKHLPSPFFQDWDESCTTVVKLHESFKAISYVY